MARRRVFKTKVECSVISGPKPRPATGQMVTLQKSASGPGIEVVWGEGTVVGSLDPAIGVQVGSAIDRGQSFTATIENAYQLSDGATWVHLKVEYLLEQGQRPIEVPKLLPPEPKGEWKTFYTNVAGVTYRNPNGLDRQRIVSRCRKGDPVVLIREPDNPFDSFAIKVLRENGEQIGYLPAYVVRNVGGGWNVARGLDYGYKYIARVSSVTGGGNKSYGLNLQITSWNGPLALQPIEEPELPVLESRYPNAEATAASGCLALSIALVLLFTIALLFLW